MEQKHFQQICGQVRGRRIGATGGHLKTATVRYLVKEGGKQPAMHNFFGGRDLLPGKVKVSTRELCGQEHWFQPNIPRGPGPEANYTEGVEEVLSEVHGRPWESHTPTLQQKQTI